MAGKPGHRGWGYVRRERSGRFSASYTYRGGRHRAPTTYGLKIDAEGWLADERRLIERNAWTPPAAREAAASIGDEAFGTYGRRCIAERNLRPRTRALYESQWTQ